MPLTPTEIRTEKKPQQLAPDVMVIFGRPKGDRGSYRQWQEENIAPQVVFEILSSSNFQEEMQKKFNFYQAHGIEEYYLYDPKKNQLTGWLRQGELLEAIATIEDWISPLLGIKFTTQTGDLVLFHPNGERFVEFVEVVEQRDRALKTADRERQRADDAEATIQQLHDRLLKLGVDPHTLP